MERRTQEFLKALERFSADCDKQVERCRIIMSALKEEELRRAVPNHMELKASVSRLMELLEGRVSPVVKKAATPPASASSAASPMSKPPDEDTHAHSATRRVIPRYNRRLSLRYGVPGHDSHLTRAFSRDIGAMGIYVLSNRKEKVGHTLYLEVELPDAGVLRMQGVVVWTKWIPQSLRAVQNSGFGVKILNAPEAWFAYFADLEQGKH